MELTARIVMVPGPGVEEDECVRWAAEARVELELHRGDPATVLGALPPAGVTGVLIAPGPDGLDAGALAAAVASTNLLVVAVVPDNVRKTVPHLDATRLVIAGARLLYGRGPETARHAVLYLARRQGQMPDTLAYGPESGQEGDLWVPAGEGPHPVAVLFHGGFWYHAWERDLMDGLALDLTRRGIAAWNVEYRRVGAGGGWPVSGEDADRATEHLLALAPVYGLDLDRVAVLGHSAGAQLALWVAARRRRATVRPILAVGLATIADLAAARAEGVGGGSVGRFLDGAGEPDRALAEASPRARLPIGVAQILAHATDDGVVPVTQTIRYAEAARGVGDDVEVIELETGGHFDLADPDTAAWAEVATAVTRRLHW